MIPNSSSSGNVLFLCKIWKGNTYSVKLIAKVKNMYLKYFTIKLYFYGF